MRVQPLIDVQRLTAALSTRDTWGEVIHLAEVDSTNLEAQRRATLWSPVLAEHQHAGRGRLGRSWQDSPGAGLALSVLVPWLTPAGWLPLAAGLAVHGALAGEGVDASLKWPNDVLLPGDEERKVCGVLCQALPSSSPPAGVVVGIGINVVHGRGDLPVPTATSLRLVGADVDRTDLAAAVLLGLRDLYADLEGGPQRAESVRGAYRAACSTIGRMVTVHRPDGGTQEVRVTGIDDEGRLLITGAHGSDSVTAGDVQHIRPSGASPRPGTT